MNNLEINIKDLAKDKKCTVKDLLVLAPQNDPFYAGVQDAPRAAGEWLADLYKNKLGSPNPCHIRRLHYALVSASTQTIKPDGEPYSNTEKDWQILNVAAKTARYLDLIPFRNIKDHRTPPATIYFTPDEDEVYSALDIDVSPDELLNDHLRYTGSVFNVCSRLPYHLEIMVEKSTIHDILEPIASRFNINLVEGMGELSITSMVDLVDRVKASGKPARIFYISDFDPAGQNMPVAAARKIQYVLYKEKLDLDIKLQTIALTEEQCKRYQLPRIPIKDSEKRRAGFEERFGEGATELDALEAVHPGELSKLVTSVIETYFDYSIAYDCREAERAARQRWEEALKEVFSQVPEIKQTVEIGLPEIPENSGKVVDENGVEWLFDSSRDYLKQLAVFKVFQGKGELK